MTANETPRNGTSARCSRTTAMWMSPAPDGDVSRIRVPAPLAAALGITAASVLAIGIYPQVFARLGDLASLAR